MNRAQYKKPWLACCYSIILPGTGHLYGNMYFEGIVWILVYIISEGLLVYTLLLDHSPLYLSLLIAFFSSIILPAYCGYNSYKKTKKGSNQINVAKKNEWLAIFFSIVFLPLGYIYLKKWLCVFLSILAFSIVLIFTDFPGNLVLITAVFCFHIALKVLKVNSKARRIFFTLMAVYVSVGFIDGLFWSSINPKCFLDITYIRAGVSMNPTLFKGDVVLENVYEKEHGEQKVGDIVSIGPIKINNRIENRFLIKRIAAVGGETIQIIAGVVYIDGQPTKRSIINQKKAYGSMGKFYEYAVNEPYKVPKGSYFLLGDYQYNSLDSRRFGAVQKKEIRAKVTKILWPPERMGILYD